MTYDLTEIVDSIRNEAGERSKARKRKFKNQKPDEPSKNKLGHPPVKKSKPNELVKDDA